MNRALLNKFLRESMLLWIALAIGLFAFAWFRVWVVGEVDTARFKQILELIPKDWRRFAAVDFDWITSYLGRTSLTLDEPMIMLLVGGWGIVRGSDVVSGEINRGTMEMVLSQPVSRTTVFLQHFWLSVGGLFLLSLIVWMGMSIGIYTTDIEESTYPELNIPLINYSIPITFVGPETETVAMIDKIKPPQFLPGIINMFCFGFFIVCYSMMFSAWDRFRWRTLGIVVGIYFVGGLVKVASMATEKLSWLKFFTFYTLYEPALCIETVEKRPESTWHLLRYSSESELLGLGPAGMNLLLLLLGTACFLVGMRAFRNRDLPAPL